MFIHLKICVNLFSSGCLTHRFNITVKYLTVSYLIYLCTESLWMQNVIDWHMSLCASYCSLPVLHSCLVKLRTGWFCLVVASVENFMLAVAVESLLDWKIIWTADIFQNSMDQGPAIQNQVYEIPVKFKVYESTHCFSIFSCLWIANKQLNNKFMLVGFTQKVYNYLDYQEILCFYGI